MTDYQTWANKTVYDTDGRKIGNVADLYYDDDATKPDWATVKSGLFGTKVHFVPLHKATEDEDGLHVVVTEAQVKDAPSLGADAELDADEEDRLYQHYGIHVAEQRGDVRNENRNDDRRETNVHHDNARQDGYGEGSFTNKTDNDVAEVAQAAASDNATSQPSGPVTIGKHPVTRKRVRLQKYIVTEMVQTTVPIQHEEVRVVGEPIDETHAGSDNRTR